ncbi:MAG: MFS transporter [Hyphomicrobiaceae bacterium]|nr:MFS transporter [Hyphomicrobiaceae bacterium]
MCIGQIGNLLPHVAVPAVMPQHLMPLWTLNATQAGLMASSFAIGYMLAVPVLTALTDRIDARRILAVGSALSGLSTIAFGLLADGLLSAMLWWTLAGIGFAGAYMPGLKALTDRLEPGDKSRSVTLYTSSFSFGVGVSFLVAQLAGDTLGWRWAFLLTGIGPGLMLIACAGMRPVAPVPSTGRLLDFRPVLRNRAALGYIFGYGMHCLELYGMRTWLVAFWSFVVAHNGGAAPLTALTVSVLVSVMAFPASILGNELALKFGRHRAISTVMTMSCLTALSLGLFAGGSPWILLALLMVYSFTVPADSGALTSGMTASAVPGQVGATMALHSTVGFGLSGLGAWGVGVAIDAAGGPAAPSAWMAGFALMALSAGLGPLILRWSRAR